MPFLSSLGAKETRALGSYPSCKVYMHVEKLEEVTLVFSKYQSTLSPIILSEDILQFVIPVPVRNERQ